MLTCCLNSKIGVDGSLSVNMRLEVGVLETELAKEELADTCSCGGGGGGGGGGGEVYH